jgi:mRNA-degrading endonuclease RelE of RelBE toxin-antitoxin system
MALPAQQIYLPEFDADFFSLPQFQQRLIEAKIDTLGRRLATFPHERLKGSRHCRLRAGDYRVIYSFDAEKNIVWLLLVGHRSKVYR